MPVCPWCNAAVGSVNEPCPGCGKMPLDHPSSKGSRAGAGATVPELDIPQRVSKPQARASLPKMQAVAAPEPSSAPAPAAPAPGTKKVIPGVATNHGNRFEDDDDDGPGLDLDLDLSKGPPMMVASVGKMPVGGSQGGVTANVPIRGAPMNAGGAPAQAPAPAPAAPAAPRAAESAGEKPRAAALAETEKPVLDPYEVRALADYGDPPAQWWKTPLYAYRVLKRRPELKKLAGIKRREAERTRAAADDALVAFAELVRSTAEPLGGFARAFEDVRAAEQVQRERDAVLAAEQDNHKQRQTQHDARITEIEGQLRTLQSEERQIAQEMAEQDTLLKRAEARMKRADIEIRNALAEAGMGPGPDGQGEPKAP